MCALPEAIVSLCWPEDRLLNIQDVSIFTLRSMVYSVSRFLVKYPILMFTKKKVFFFFLLSYGGQSQFSESIKETCVDKEEIKAFWFWFFA